MKPISFYSIAILTTMLSIFSSCKDKEVVIDKCSNGFLDIGETGIDCGGNCTPCIVNEPSSIYLEFNGTPFSYSSKTLTYSNNNWSLEVLNDSISFQFNLGSDGTIGTYTMDPVGCFAVRNGNYYLNSNAGIYSISMHDQTNHKMSGFFSANFTRTGYNDTLKVRNGQFEYMPY